MAKEVKCPSYITEIYGWLYNSDKLCKFFNKRWMQKMLSFGQCAKLEHSVLKEIESSSKILQMGITNGDLMYLLADRAGKYGRFDVIDVNKDQIQRTAAKYINHNVSFHNHDARNLLDKQDYDVVVCYLLLKELPIVSKMKVINNALASVREGGKVIFVDYDNPVPYHPLRYIVRMFNRLYQPFAEKMWDRDISSFCNNPTDFMWRKSSFFGHFYQKLVVIKREKAGNILQKETLF